MKSNQRNLIARYEHERWNSFMIMNGFTMMKISEFNKNLISQKKKPSRDILKKKHICITTFEDLLNLAKIIEAYNKKNNTSMNIDYILYDYQLMDNLPSILKGSEYCIIRYLEDKNES